MQVTTEHETIRRGATSSARLLTAAGLEVHSSAMARLAREGAVERIIPGVYIGTSHPRHPLIEVAAWTLRHPEAVACLLTAAVYHELTDAFPRGVWLFVPLGTPPPRSRVASVHVVQVAPWMVDRADDAANGILSVSAHGVTVRVTGPDRTVLDLWRYPRLISAEHALVGLRRRVSTPGFNVPAFARLARRLGAWSKVEPVLQGMMVR